MLFHLRANVSFWLFSYIFHVASAKISWEDSKTLCENNGSKLVSMENVSAELNFLKYTAQAMEYYIGLRKDHGEWRWISNNSTVEATEREGKFPWAWRQPQGDGNCVKMYFDRTNNLVYDDIHCSRRYWPVVGYICERQLVECNNKNGMYCADQGMMDYIYLFIYF